MKMETSFYHDINQRNVSSVKQLKQKMTLDLAGPSGKREKLAGVLASPDLNMLKLASPELERMIIAQNGTVTTTPTPTQFLCPKYVTEEQDAYARGFVDALAELYKKEGVKDEDALSQAQSQVVTLVPNSNINLLPSNPSINLTQLQPVSSAKSVNPLVSTATSFAPTGALHLQEQELNTIAVSTQASVMPSQITRVKEEPQTVPCMGLTPPISPINMDVQEDMKLERKRERNRMAARKCRTRKLERISKLEDRVSLLKGENSGLVVTATSLRDQVAKLKQQIIEHVNSGCQVMMSQNLL